jgi:hypothetical protein
VSTHPLVVAFDVHASVEGTHAFIIHDFFLNHQRWDPGIIELVALDDGPVRPGKRGREVRRFMGTKVTEFEVVEADARRLTIRDVPSAWTLERTWAFEPTPAGTRITFTFDMRPRTPLFRLAYPLAKVPIARQVRQNMNRLHRILSPT